MSLLGPDYMSRAGPVNCRAGVSLPGSRARLLEAPYKDQLRDYMTTGSARLARDPGIAVPGSRLLPS